MPLAAEKVTVRLAPAPPTPTPPPPPPPPDKVVWIVEQPVGTIHVAATLAGIVKMEIGADVGVAVPTATAVPERVKSPNLS